MSEPIPAQKAPYGVNVEAGKDYVWCACGHSATQPFATAPTARSDCGRWSSKRKRPKKSGCAAARLRATSPFATDRTAKSDGAPEGLYFALGGGTGRPSSPALRNSAPGPIGVMVKSDSTLV